MQRTNYEWGFKMVPTTSADKHLHWNKRLKAIGAYIPVQHVDEAKYKISELLLPDGDSLEAQQNLYLDRYVFVR